MNAPIPSSPLRRAGVRALLAVAVLGGALWLGWHFWPRPAAPPAPTPPSHTFQPSAEQLKSLGIQPVALREFRTRVHAEGSIAYDQEASSPVYSPFSGQVVKVRVHLGDRVSRGQALMTVAAGEAAQGRSDVASARAALDTARATEQRQHDLYDAGAAAERDWLQARTDRISAEAAWSAARARLRILGRSDAEIDALERAPAGSPETVVRAPADGVITQRAVNDGDYVQSLAAGASGPAFVVSDVRRVWVVGAVREGDAPTVRAGQPVSVRIAALEGRTFTTTLGWVASDLDPSTHRLGVRAAIANPDGALKPQMYVDLSIGASAATRAPAVPESALVYDGSVRRVFVEREGLIRGREVRLGRSADGYVEVLEGLAAGERIVTSGTLFVDHTPAGD